MSICGMVPDAVIYTRYLWHYDFGLTVQPPISNDSYSRTNRDYCPQIIGSYITDQRTIPNLLVCPRCHGQMKVLSFIEQGDIIKKILRRLDLWKTRNHDPMTRKARDIFHSSSWTRHIRSFLKQTTIGFNRFFRSCVLRLHSGGDPKIGQNIAPFTNFPASLYCLCPSKIFRCLQLFAILNPHNMKFRN